MIFKVVNIRAPVLETSCFADNMQIFNSDTMCNMHFMLEKLDKFLIIIYQSSARSSLLGNSSATSNLEDADYRCIVKKEKSCAVRPSDTLF